MGIDLATPTMIEQSLKPTPEIRLKSIALPAEHGGWGFLIEPMILGMLVAPSLVGVFVCLAALGVFLLHQPLRIVAKDRLRGRRFRRTLWAERFATAYGLLTVLGLVLVLQRADSAFWLPILLACPFAIVQILYEIRNQGRQIIPEVCGALALGAICPAIVVADGQSIAAALLLWGLIGFRIIPSLVYVRAQLRRIKGKSVKPYVPLAIHGLSLVGMALMWWSGLLGTAAVIASCILLLRAAYGLFVFRHNTPARVIGMQEMIWGIIYVLLVASGVMK